MFPEPSGSFAKAAAACTTTSGGRYRIAINFLSTSSDQQRVSLVRRLAANDSSIDILVMDVDWTAEFANAQWIRPVPAELAAQIRSVDLPGPVQTATYQRKYEGLTVWLNSLVDSAGSQIITGGPGSCAGSWRRSRPRSCTKSRPQPRPIRR